MILGIFALLLSSIRCEGFQITQQEMTTAINAKAQETRAIIDNKVQQLNSNIEKSENNMATWTVNMF
jgi:acetolactate synthase regulatory subunit